MARKAAGDPATGLVGKALTVRGPVEPDKLGASIMHEHLLLDLRKTHLPRQSWVIVDGRVVPKFDGEDFPATELAVWEAKLGLGNLHLALEMAPITDNYVLSDVDLAIEEAMEYKKAGGGTMVDVTSIGIKRSPVGLRQVSEATGLNIVMGTGFYQRVYHPYDMDTRTVEDLTAEIVRDVTFGVGGTGIRSGIIGEIGINGGPITPNEVKSTRAAARASRETGASISFHLGGDGPKEIHQTLSTVAEEGADLERVIVGHADGLSPDMPAMLGLLERGVYIQFDLIGRPSVLEPSKTHMVAQAIPGLIAAGYGDRVLLSHDVCWKTHLKKYGGFGYSFILEKFLPYLRSKGVADSDIDKMMVSNPRAVLTFVEPQV